jgi:uncharacterized protein (TIGR02145 family)
VKSLKIFSLILLGLTFALGCSDNSKGKVTDIEGNIYPTMTYGGQTWMVENLKTTKYNDGTDIPNVTVDSLWNTSKAGAYSWYGNDAATNKDSHGALYNWYAVDTKKLCPTGWHVPSDKEWRTLTSFFGGEIKAGNTMKNDSGWNKNGNGTNASGFSAFPAGYRNSKGPFSSHGLSCYWWASNGNEASSWYTVLFSKDETAYKYYGLKQSGFSVRCVKD